MCVISYSDFRIHRHEQGSARNFDSLNPVVKSLRKFENVPSCASKIIFMDTRMFDDQYHIGDDLSYLMCLEGRENHASSKCILCDGWFKECASLGQSYTHMELEYIFELYRIANGLENIEGISGSSQELPQNDNFTPGDME